ncbi:MAG: radical SAM protein [Bacilli bacterium]|nr:radical SAM protein [Bacilli bacterium]
MDKLDVKNLYLEVTRDCTLECIHCYRGEKEDKYLSFDVIDKVFSGVEKIHKLLITGGEPFLALEQLKRIAYNIQKNAIKIDRITIVTNGTILSKEIIDLIVYFSNISYLELDISSDKFHEIELERLGLLERKQKNVARLNELFSVEELIPTRYPKVIHKLGRAINLTTEDLHYINNLGDVQTKYVLSFDEELEKMRAKYRELSFDGSFIDGYLYIDVNGNIVPAYASFKEEDENVYSSLEGKTLVKAIRDIKISN